MSVYQINPSAIPTVNSDNVFLTLTNIVKAGVPTEPWGLNGIIVSGSQVSFIVQAYFMPMYNGGVQLNEGTLLANAPVTLSLDSKKFTTKSTAGVTLTIPGSPDFVITAGGNQVFSTTTNSLGEAALVFTVSGPVSSIVGPAGTTAVVCLSGGTETYEYTMYLS